MTRITVEAMRSVADSFGGDFEDARNFIPSQREFRWFLEMWMEETRINTEESSKFTFVKRSAKFVEFDSGNASHAGAIYSCEFDGPKDLIEQLEKEDD